MADLENALDELKKEKESQNVSLPPLHWVAGGKGLVGCQTKLEEAESAAAGLRAQLNDLKDDKLDEENKDHDQLQKLKGPSFLLCILLQLHSAVPCRPGGGL